MEHFGWWRLWVNERKERKLDLIASRDAEWAPLKYHFSISRFYVLQLLLPVFWIITFFSALLRHSARYYHQKFLYYFFLSLHESLKVNYCSVMLSSKHKFCVFTVLNMWLNLHLCLLLNFPNPFTARDSALCLKTPLFLSPASYFLFPQTDLKGL